MESKYRKPKDQMFKIRCDNAVSSTGLSHHQFYKKIGISKQRWYSFSWRIESFPSWLKIKLCDLFGKPFRDFFLQDIRNEKTTTS